MKKFNIQLSSINDVKRLVNAATARSCDIDIVSGRYLVDAKSIMGLFSLDLSKPIMVDIHGEDAEAEKFLSDIKELVVE